MERRYRLFFDIISELNREGILQGLILIGGWCLIIYKQYFGDPVEISTLRTVDIDFFIPYLPLVVPEPAAFVLHKFIVSNRRQDQAKREKDIKTARELGEYLIKDERQREKIKNIYSDLPTKWKEKSIKMIRQYSEEIFNALI